MGAGFIVVLAGAASIWASVDIFRQAHAVTSIVVGPEMGLITSPDLAARVKNPSAAILIAMLMCSLLVIAAATVIIFAAINGWRHLSAAAIRFRIGGVMLLCLAGLQAIVALIFINHLHAVLYGVDAVVLSQMIKTPGLLLVRDASRMLGAAAAITGVLALFASRRLKGRDPDMMETQ